MLHVVTTGAYYPPVVTTWKILTTGASQLTAGSLCTMVLTKASAMVLYSWRCYSVGGARCAQVRGRCTPRSGEAAPDTSA